MDTKDIKKPDKSTGASNTKQQQAAKDKRLEAALRSNLARRKEAQKARPHRKTAPSGS